jgi:hypothetical protein
MWFLGSSRMGAVDARFNGHRFPVDPTRADLRRELSALEAG